MDADGAVFDASQYSFFGKHVIDAVELGGLEDEEEEGVSVLGGGLGGEEELQEYQLFGKNEVKILNRCLKHFPFYACLSLDMCCGLFLNLDILISFVLGVLTYMDFDILTQSYCFLLTMLKCSVEPSRPGKMIMNCHPFTSS